MKVDPAYEKTIRHVMLRMVAIGGGELARRQVPLSELEYPPEKNRLVKEVIERFTNARLLVQGKDAEGNSYVEPAHDGLVRGWVKLQNWITTEQENLTLRQRLILAVNDWSSNRDSNRGQDSQFLWNNDPRLNQLKQVEKSNNNWLNLLELKFVEQSIQKYQDELEKTKEQLRISEERRKASLARQLSAQANLISQEYPKGERFELQILLAIESLKLMPSLEADQLLRQSLALLPSSSSFSLHFPDNQSMLDNFFYSWCWKNDSKTFVVANASTQSIQMVDILNNGIIKNLEFNLPHFKGVALSSNGKYAAIVTETNTLIIFELETNKKVYSWDYKQEITKIKFTQTQNSNFLKIIYQDDSGSVKQNIIQIQFPNLKFFLFLNEVYHDNITVFSYNNLYWANLENEVVKVREVKTEKTILATQNLRDDIFLESLDSNNATIKNDNSGIPKFSSFSENGQYFAVATTEGLVRVWDLQNRKSIFFQEEVGWIDDMLISPNGQYLIINIRKHYPIIWDIFSQQENLSLKNYLRVERIAFSPDSHYLAIAEAGTKTCLVYDLSTKKIISIKVFYHYPIHLTFSEDSRYLLLEEDEFGNHSNIQSITIHACQINNKSRSEITKLNLTDIEEMWIYNYNGQYLINTSKENYIQVFDWLNNREIKRINITTNYKIEVDTNGKYLAVSFWDKPTKIWDLEQGKEIKSIGHGANHLAFSLDGKYLTTVDKQDNISIWNVNTGDRVYCLQYSQVDDIFDFTEVKCLSYDGRYVALLKKYSNSEKYNPFILIVHDTVSQQEKIFELWDKDLGQGWQFIFSSNNQYIVGFGGFTSGAGYYDKDGIIQVWELSSGQELFKQSLEIRIDDIIFSSDSQFMAGLTWENMIIIWDLKHHRQISYLIPQLQNLQKVLFTPDDQYVVGINAHFIEKWLFKPEDLIKQACGLISRNLTQEEWQEYFGDEPYYKICETIKDLETQIIDERGISEKLTLTT